MPIFTPCLPLINPCYIHVIACISFSVLLRTDGIKRILTGNCKEYELQEVERGRTGERKRDKNRDEKQEKIYKKAKEVKKRKEERGYSPS